MYWQKFKPSVHRKSSETKKPATYGRFFWEISEQVNELQSAFAFIAFIFHRTVNLVNFVPPVKIIGYVETK